MSKYANLISDVESVFGSSTWTANNISTFPSNFNIPSNLSEFVKIETLPLRINTDYGRFGVEGLIIIQVYVSANQGVRRLMEVADLLDLILENKLLANGTQTQSSNLQILGQDSDNPELFRADFTVNFTFYN